MIDPAYILQLISKSPKGYFEIILMICLFFYEQRKAILMTKSIREQAMSDLYCNFFPEALCIAHLGCASGSNTFLVISELVQTVEQERKKHGLQLPEFHFLFNDLPSNDFNNIFQLLREFEHNLRIQIAEEFGPCFLEE